MVDERSVDAFIRESLVEDSLQWCARRAPNRVINLENKQAEELHGKMSQH
jgi:hypothetical protein